MSGAARHLDRRTGYSFTDPNLLQQALSHRSASGRSYERLEFLGDAILNFLVAEALYRRLDAAEEGELTRLRARLVRRESLAGIARELELGGLLRLGPGELKTGARERDSILADALEALIGAIYLDGGILPCREWVLRVFERPLQRVLRGEIRKDPKTRLQEYLQARGQALPEYGVTGIRGAEHEREFTVECRIEGLDAVTVGQGSSRRRAEQQAAQRALGLLEDD